VLGAIAAYKVEMTDMPQWSVYSTD
jgi:hypothetical protein